MKTHNLIKVTAEKDTVLRKFLSLHVLLNFNLNLAILHSN